MAIGSRVTFEVSSGPNLGTPTDFFIDGQQLGAAAAYDSLGSCGLSNGYLFAPDFNKTTTTFNCNDWFGKGENAPAPSTRSQIQVDGADAYAPQAAEYVNKEAANLPALAYSYTQDPSNGDLTINESDPLVSCSSPTYPPTPVSCASFVDTGVEVERTIVQSEDGHLVTIGDRYRSTDNEAHSLSLLPQNDQFFGKPGIGSGENGEKIEYRFPGESGFSTRGEGETVAFSGTAPGTILIRVEGAADGDTATGRGAIVFDRPASPATFNQVETRSSNFYFHQSVAVPAGGTALVRFAYVQGYTGAEVESLAQRARSSFEPAPLPPQPPSPGPKPGATPAAISPNPAHCVVPRLTGRTLKAARKALTGADCKLGKIRGRRSKAARVRKQGSKPGASLPPGSEIGVKLG
jgi:hypothetical protein